MSGVSLGSESSFSDDSSWTGSDSLSCSPTGIVELHSTDSGLAEERLSPSSPDLNPPEGLLRSQGSTTAQGPGGLHPLHHFHTQGCPGVQSPPT
uniref:Uncharacterized protein n=1 Tax=Anguilla anguilla TaxID=7936 RepID=A0A0E9SIW9_ANGAN